MFLVCHFGQDGGGTIGRGTSIVHSFRESLLEYLPPETRVFDEGRSKDFWAVRLIPGGGSDETSLDLTGEPSRAAKSFYTAIWLVPSVVPHNPHVSIGASICDFSADQSTAWHTSGAEVQRGRRRGGGRLRSEIVTTDCSLQAVA